MNYIVALLYLFLPFTEEPLDSIVLQGVDVVASMKTSDVEKGAYSSSNFGRVDLENRHITSVKELSALAPNFYQPDYGSRMTSSIYVRGFGSRIDQPVVGMNIDQQPVLNKNNYDFDLFDIAGIQIVRGAQSTLFGRNTSGGAINIETLSPLVFQGKRLTLEYGNENTIRLKASHFAAPSKRFGWSVAVYYAHTDGYFMNKERGENCDESDNVSTRLRFQYLPSDAWSIDNSLTIGFVDEGGYAYRNYNAETKFLAPVAYNDACSYQRFNLSNGLVVKRFFDNFALSSITGYSYTDDRMDMDNDFLPLDYFTLGQYQKEHSLSQEFVAKSSDDKSLKWLGGLSLFYKHLNLDAPVLFKKYGIDNLILKNANEHFYHPNGYDLQFRDDTFPIEDKFLIPTFGTALYSRLSYTVGSFEFTAGLRLDYEYSFMDYNSYANLYYKYDKNSNEYIPLESRFKGDDNLDALELLPRFSVTYSREWGSVYASASRGFKAGGFNTQLFSDILQKRITDDIIGNRTDNDASATVYKPETNWTYEIGAHISPFKDELLNISGTMFFIDCRDQQLTVFPKGMSTGRMMSNAGKSHSYGAELELSSKIGPITLHGSYGYVHATFKNYISGNDDYSGNYLPFAPSETASANISYNIPVPRTLANFLILNVGWNRVGRIYWNEDNSLSQPFYDLFSASLSWEKGHFGASLWGKNLLNEEYNTFYFKSINNDFFAQGKPLQFGLSLHLNL